VVLSQRFELPDCDGFSLYRTLRAASPAPYHFYLRVGGRELFGASPELLVQVEAGKMTVRPIAGTRRRGTTQEEDLRLEEELRADPKECAEHTMLVDLGRNDVGRVSRIGSVKVERLMETERFSHVMHMTSEVTGQLRPGLGAVDAFAAAFPAGTLSGAPKIRALEIIDELETVQRGPYGGAVGWFSSAGDVQLGPQGQDEEQKRHGAPRTGQRRPGPHRGWMMCEPPTTYGSRSRGRRCTCCSPTPGAHCAYAPQTARPGRPPPHALSHAARSQRARAALPDRRLETLRARPARRR